MADTLTITTATGTATLATDDIGGVHHQRVKLSIGADGSATDAPGGAGAVSAGVPRVTLASDDPAVALLGTIDADTGAISTNTSGAATSLAIIDDWDETDRAKVNIIVGQAGIAAGAGAVGVTVPRVTLASDDPVTTSVQIMDDWDESDRAKVNLIVGQAGVAAGAGAVGATTQRVTLASDDPLVTAVTASIGYNASVTLTRTADTNAYTANDVIGAATGSTAGIEFTSMGPSGGRITITSVSLEIQAAAIISGETSYVLHLYNVTPPSALGDNTAFDLPSGDRASYLGSINLGTPVDLGSTLYIAQDGINKQIKLSGTSVFAYLVTVGAYTPTSARVYVIKLNAVSL